MANERATKKDDADVIVGYKGFNADWTCRGMQYEVGKTYTHDGPLSLCSSGLHFCENPLDVWRYYPLDLKHPIAEVEASNVSEETSVDSKRAARTLTINVAIDISVIVRAAVEWIRKAAGVNDNIAAASGYASNLAASGSSSHLAASGDSSRLAASGESSNLAASGPYSNLAASGYASRLAASGYASRLAASGAYSNLAASGDYSTVMGAGYFSSASAGPGGCIALAWHDGNRPRITIGYVGEGGIEANVAYRCDKSGKLVPA